MVIGIWHLKIFHKEQCSQWAHPTELWLLSGLPASYEWQTNGWTGRLLQLDINESVASSIKDLKQFPCPSSLTLAPERGMKGEKSSFTNWNTFCFAGRGTQLGWKNVFSWQDGELHFPAGPNNSSFCIEIPSVKGPLLNPKFVIFL